MLTGPVLVPKSHMEAVPRAPPVLDSRGKENKKSTEIASHKSTFEKAFFYTPALQLKTKLVRDALQEVKLKLCSSSLYIPIRLVFRHQKNVSFMVVTARSFRLVLV